MIAESFERIHRSNLIGMGVLPLQFPDGESVESLGLTGEETFDVGDLEDGEAKTVTVTAPRDDGADQVEFEATVRLDTPNEVTYFHNGGILQTVLRNLRDGQSTGPKRGAAGPREAGGSARPSLHLRVGSQGGMPTRPFPWTGLPRGTVSI